MIVVPVFITSCQVSEKSNKGPQAAQITTISKAIEKAYELPAQDVIVVENFSKKLRFFFLFIIPD
jgi:hypothetical protein